MDLADDDRVFSFDLKSLYLNRKALSDPREILNFDENKRDDNYSKFRRMKDLDFLQSFKKLDTYQD